MLRIPTVAVLTVLAAAIARGAESTTATPPSTTPATVPATTAATTRAIVMPEGKNWKIVMPDKRVQVNVLVPKTWERGEPSEKSPPMIFQPGSLKATQRATWYYAVLDAKRDKPQRVLDRAILGRTNVTPNFEIREQKAFTRPDGTDAATLLYIARDDKGNQFVSRETYYWVDDNHLLVTFEWATRGAWGEVRRDLEAMTASVKIEPYTPPTQPATTRAKS